MSEAEKKDKQTEKTPDVVVWSSEICTAMKLCEISSLRDLSKTKLDKSADANTSVVSET